MPEKRRRYYFLMAIISNTSMIPGVMRRAIESGNRKRLAEAGSGIAAMFTVWGGDEFAMVLYDVRI